jgi:hypothetical protein
VNFHLRYRLPPLVFSHWLLPLSSLELLDAEFQYFLFFELALISLACLLVGRHQTTPLLILEATLAGTERIWLADHTGFDSLITLPLCSTSCKATMG